MVRVKEILNFGILAIDRRNPFRHNIIGAVMALL